PIPSSPSSPYRAQTSPIQPATLPANANTAYAFSDTSADSPVATAKQRPFVSHKRLPMPAAARPPLPAFLTTGTLSCMRQPEGSARPPTGRKGRPRRQIVVVFRGLPGVGLQATGNEYDEEVMEGRADTT